MRRFAAAVVVALLALAAGAAWNPQKEAAHTRAGRIVSGEDYQSTFPERLDTFKGNPEIRFPPWAASLFHGAGYVLIALAAVGLVAALITAFARSGRRGPVAGSTPAAVQPLPESPPDAPPPTLEDADRLAEAGAYREAVHLLLLVAVGEAARQTYVALPPSTTGRELTSVLPVEGALREGFEVLVRAVERVLFGGGDAGADDYAACRLRCVSIVGQGAA